MQTKIISICHGKGGVGKTQVVMLLAGELATRGVSVMVVDCDSQASASHWAGAASDSNPFAASVINLASFGGKVHREIQKHIGSVELILVDCPAALENSATQSVLLITDISIIPIPPSPTDFWATKGMKELIERAQVINPELRAYILRNRVTRTSLSKAIAEELESLGLPVMTSQLRNRTAYQEAAISGTTVRDLGRSAKAAADEVCELCDELMMLIGEKI